MMTRDDKKSKFSEIDQNSPKTVGYEVLYIICQSFRSVGRVLRSFKGIPKNWNKTCQFLEQDENFLEKDENRENQV